MPIHDYKCEQCFELEENVLQDISDLKKEYRCKTCGGFMIRQFPQAAFQLKGGGWYKDLYQKPPTKQNDKDTEK